MEKVFIRGLSEDERREFEVMDREQLEKMINDLDWEKIYKATYYEALGWTMRGRVITYIDARNGEIETYWIGQNAYKHPFDDFYEIVLCEMETVMSEPDAEEYLDNKEYEEYIEGLYDKWEDLKMYATIKGINLKERLEDIIEYYATDVEPMNYNWIKKQLDDLYRHAK